MIRTTKHKYILWAFGPAIKASDLCMHVIRVDDTHLKGPYKGKLLMQLPKMLTITH